MNSIKTLLLLGALTGIFLFIGAMAGGQRGMLLALIFAGVMNFISYWFSDKIVLTAYSKRLPLQTTQQTAHLFIVSPLSGKSLLSLFSTHPPLEERGKRLRQMRFS